MNKAICRKAGGRDRITELIVAASGTSCNCTTPPMIKPTSHRFFLCVCVFVHIRGVHVCHLWHCLVSWVSFSRFHILICHFHGNPMIQGAPANMNVCLSGKERDRKGDGEGGQERERVIEWTVHYHGQLYWIKMADRGWEHIRGAFIIQHLIEGAG